MSELITVLVSSSPILTHPDTTMIEETIRSIRAQLPDSPIKIMCDGVREEQAHLAPAYKEYIKELVKQMLFNWENVYVYPFPTFQHQAVMTIRTLDTVQTPLILFVEHDTPLMDRPNDWDFLVNTANAGISPMIRFHYDETIHPDHLHLMWGELTPYLIKTTQWSQRPHLANKVWYETLLQKHFSPESRTFIEDKIYGVVVNEPWEWHQLSIYNPEGTGQNMKRSRDLNGRGDEQKYPLTF
jgi:hypothetical protein